MTRIVFMGTPTFAARVLASLADNYEVGAVYTRVDKPAGRGRQVSESPVKTLARERGLPVEQPGSLRSDQAQMRLMDYRPDLIVVTAYGLILPQRVLDIPRLGSINTHASLLPRWRGAAPITAAILMGDAETGITLMQMDAGIDTGPVIAVRKIGITPEDTTSTLSDKLSLLAAKLIIESLPAWLEGKIVAVPQSGDASFTSFLKKEDGLIDWTKPAVEIERAVRAYNPWPSAYTYWPPSGLAEPEKTASQPLKIWRAGVLAAPLVDPPGTIVTVGGKIAVNTGSGLLLLREVQLAGRRAMAIEEFVRGQRGFVGSRLGQG